MSTLTCVTITQSDEETRTPVEDRRRGIFVVQPPFDADAHADVILRSSDGVDFRVITSILVHSSSFFRALFTLPQPSESSTLYLRPEYANSSHGVGSHHQSDLPVVPLFESSAKTLDSLLRILYPIISPSISDLDLISNLIKAGLKYDIGLVVDRARKALCTTCANDQTNVMKVYLIACEYKMRDIAELAGYASLKRPFMEEYIPDLERLTAVEFYRIFDYHRKAVSAVQTLFLDDHYGAPFSYNIANAIVDRSETCPHRKPGEIMTSEHNGLGLMEIAETVCFLGWWVSLRNTIYAEISKGPAADDLLTFEVIWTEARGCCSYCQNKVEIELRYGLLDNLKSEVRKLIMQVELELPWK